MKKIYTVEVEHQVQVKVKANLVSRVLSRSRDSAAFLSVIIAIVAIVSSNSQTKASLKFAEKESEKAHERSVELRKKDYLREDMLEVIEATQENLLAKNEEEKRNNVLEAAAKVSFLENRFLGEKHEGLRGNLLEVKRWLINYNNPEGQNTPFNSGRHTNSKDIRSGRALLTSVNSIFQVRYSKDFR